MNIVVDKSLCMSCRVCEIACSQKHFGIYNPQLARLRVPQTFPIPSSPQICLQCITPKCASACPTKALSREGNMVAFYEEKCVGCGACVKACPFKRIWMSSYGKPLKCDLCGGNPECVQVCGKHALSIKNT